LTIGTGASGGTGYSVLSGSAQNVLLYVVTILIWGSSWLVIKFQLGVVDPMVSVAYRFLFGFRNIMDLLQVFRTSVEF
jgi:hypothetical protein